MYRPGSKAEVVGLRSESGSDITIEFGDGASIEIPAELLELVSLPAPVKEKILSFGEDSMGTHRVALVLSDGRLVEDVVVAWGAEVISVAGSDLFELAMSDVVDALDRRR
jgi:hypothetical protein